jgi:hypothetical protein
MLKPIHHVASSPALAACQRLMQALALWLSEPAITAASITQQNLQPPTFASAVEADWLWNFLQRVDAGQALLTHAQTLAGMSAQEKAALHVWVQTVSALSAQFQPAPEAWPVAMPAIAEPAWKAFKTLMEGFYEKGLRSGLPYRADGTPVAAGGVGYADFVQAFRDTHRLNPDPAAREVCVLCGGPLGQTPEVDHWIAKSAFPLLSVCADNLLPICGECNSTANKGEKAVHSAGSFADWFHPYLRHANGSIHIGYNLQKLAIAVSPGNPADAARVDNLDKLLNLAQRWTRAFKAEYANQQGRLRRTERQRRSEGLPPHTQAEIQAYIQNEQEKLLPTEPHHEIHMVLFAAMLDQARLASWTAELGLQP